MKIYNKVIICVLTILNSLWPIDTICQHRSRSGLAQVMACCLTAPSHYIVLTHCGLVMPYGDIDQHWLRHQAITWTNVDFSSVMSHDIHLREISQEIPRPSIIEMSLKMTCLKWYSNLPGANELTRWADEFYSLWCIDVCECRFCKWKLFKA